MITSRILLPLAFFIAVLLCCRTAIGRNIAIGAHAQSSGHTWLKTTSAAIILHICVMIKHAPVVAKLIIIAGFIDFGSLQTSTGRAIISITIFMIGSVTRKFFWLARLARSLICELCLLICES